MEGSLQTRKWQDQQGQDRYTTEIKASRVQFLDRREADNRPMDEGAASHKAGRGQQDDELGRAFATDASKIDDMPF